MKINDERVTMLPMKRIMIRLISLIIFVLLVVLSISVYKGTAALAAETPIAGTATPDVQPVLDYGGVVAEGRIVPSNYINLSFKVDGEVAEILVKEGSQVKSGDLIARLKMDQHLEANITLAEKGVLNAQQAVDDLKKNAGVDQARVMQSISDYSDKLRQAQRMSYYYTVPDRVAVFNMFEAIDKTHEKVVKARNEYEPYIDLFADSASVPSMPPLFCIPATLCRGVGLQSDQDPNMVYKKKLNDAEGDFNIALTQLRNTANLNRSQAMLDKAKRDLEKVKTGPNQDKLAVAEKRLQTAQFNLEAAKTAIKDLELHAPFDGTVVSLPIKLGENVKSGKNIGQLADTSNWTVETNNLTEIQVVKIEKGQSAQIVADALSGVDFKGVVDRISDFYVEKSGDVTYTVKVNLLQPDPRLRWGMTVVVTFPTK